MKTAVEALMRTVVTRPSVREGTKNSVRSLTDGAMRPFVRYLIDDGIRLFMGCHKDIGPFMMISCMQTSIRNLTGIS